MTSQPTVDLLEDLRVLDLSRGPGRLTARLLADLGADVIRVDVDEEDTDQTDLRRVVLDANKRSVRGAADLTAMLPLVATAGILVEDGRPGELAARGLTADVLASANPRLVVVSLSQFGQNGPYRDWSGTEAVHMALGAVLSRSGLPGRTPVLPPQGLAGQSAALQAAWAGLIAWFHSASTRRGDSVDVSLFEAAAGVLDPGFGIAGSASGGVPAKDGPRGRPDARHLYPIFACADGHVRICLLAPRQWRGMQTWLGEPEALSDPALDDLGRRFAAKDLIFPFIAENFQRHTRAELTGAGAEHGFPIAALLTPREVARADQFIATRSFAEVDVEGLGPVQIDNGYLSVDGRRAGVRRPAPVPGSDDQLVIDPGPASVTPAPSAPTGARPLEGLRVLDLGVIVVGAETGRLLADMGAEVIKIESSAFPDGSRQSLTPGPIAAAFAYGHRGKSSLGLNLRSDEGKSVFRRLVAVSDVVLSNFKPGALAGLGFSTDELTAINPGIITVESSAFGSTGPWSRRMGYGPLVRASAGLTGLWSEPGVEDAWCDASTVYPDHAAARVGALSVVAALARRRRTGRGAHVDVSQSDAILGLLAPMLARESLGAASPDVVWDRPDDAPRGVYPCAGDDEWVVVDCRDDRDWAGIAGVIGSPELAADPRFATPETRLAHRAELDEVLTAWTSRETPRDAMVVLQDAGVPAGAMNRVIDLATDPHLAARGFLAVQPQPQIDDVLWAEARHAHFAVVPDPELRPAPLPFEHTREVMTRVLDADDAEIDRLVAEGALQLPAAT